MERRTMYRSAFGLVLIAAALFLLLSVASHDPHDPPWRFADAPVNAQPTNLCGIVGAHVAFAAKLLFGVVSYVLALGLGVFGDDHRIGPGQAAVF